MRFTCPECELDFEGPRPDDDVHVKCPECGTQFTDVDATVMDDLGPLAAGGVQAGKELGGFRIGEKIGTGAMGEVYEAVQLSLDRRVALKVLPSVFAERPAFVKRFYEESMALSALNHPNIVSIIERGNVGKIYFFVMEYVDGRPLQELMEEPLDVEFFLKVAKGTAAALDYAHKHDVVHRDIKPANIMVTDDVQVKVADFGLAGLMAQERRAAMTGARQPRRMGTPAYMSPEQKRNPLEVDGRTDLWAAGIVFYELMAGQRPDLPSRKMPSELTQTADPRLDPIVARCLMDDPADRYQSAADLMLDLTRVENELQRAPRCPACGELSPVRFVRCAKCDESLEEFFDVCPDCKHKNRREVRHCLQCGVDLERGRTIVGTKISMQLEQADRYRLQGRFPEALQMLTQVEGVQGRAFEQDRQRAALLRDKVHAERREAAKRDFADAKRMVREHRFKEAVELLRKVPTDIKDTGEAVKATLQLQARLAAERKSESTMNLAMIAVFFTIVVIILLVLVFGG